MALKVFACARPYGSGSQSLLPVLPVLPVGRQCGRQCGRQVAPTVRARSARIKISQDENEMAVFRQV